MTEERKFVTILFADFVGSTTMSGDNDAEVVRTALDAAFERIAGIVHEHGGTVEKFIGDAVMAVFGVPRAHDDDAERAVRAAFGIRHVLRSIQEPLPLEVRIGINTGEVLTRSHLGDQRLATGLAVNLAQRLQAAAASGELLVGELTHRLTERSIRYGDPRRIVAKGVGDTAAWPAEDLLRDPSARPREIERLRAPIVDRTDEMRQLRAAFGRAVSELRPRLLTVIGPPGIGKSRLAEECLTEADPDRILRGRCVPYGEAATYPIEQMLKTDARIDARDLRDDAASKVRARVAEVLGSDPDLEAVQSRILVLAGVMAAAETLVDMPEQDIAQELRWAFRRYIERRAGSEGIVLLFEDLHWAAPVVLEAIEHLTEWARAPLLVLCLARPDLRDAVPTWGVGRGDAETLELRHLTLTETAELIQGLLDPGALSERVVGEVFARSEGNALCVEECVRALLETGRIVLREGRWVSVPGAAVGIPVTLQGLVAARLDRLSNDVRRVLQVAAIIGRTFSSAALSALHGPSVPDLLREAIKSDVIEETDTWVPARGAIYRFRHVLLHEAAYGMLPKTDRAVLHDRHRAWMEEIFAERGEEHVELVAHHAGRAYESATEVRSPEVERLARIALDRLRTAARRAHDRGDLAASSDLWERARGVSEVLPLAEAERIQLEGNVVLMRISVAPDDAVWGQVEDLLSRARALGPSEVLVRLLIASGWRAYTFAFDAERSAALMHEALAGARAIGDHELITHALLQLPVVMAGSQGDMDRLGRMYEEALAYAKANGTSRELPACVRAVAEWARRAGSFTRAVGLLEEAERLAEERGSKVARLDVLLIRAEVAIWTGPADAAVILARQVRPLADAVATREAQINFLVTLGSALFEAGDLAGSRERYEEALTMTDPEKTPYEFVYVATHLVFPLLGLGDLAGARRLYAVLGPIDIPWQNHRAMRALVAASLREAEGALEDAEEMYRRSIAIFERATTALTRLHWAEQRFAELLLRQGRVAEARDLLERVARFYGDPLAAPRRAQVEALLRQCQAVAVREPN